MEHAVKIFIIAAQSAMSRSEHSLRKYNPAEYNRAARAIEDITAVKFDMSKPFDYLRSVDIVMQNAGVLSDILNINPAFIELYQASVKNDRDIIICGAVSQEVMVAEAQRGRLGPSMVRAIRACSAELPDRVRDAIVDAVRIDRVNELFAVKRIALQSDRLLQTQILTRGPFIPLSPAMGRNTFFSALGVKYDISLSVAENLNRVARANGIMIVHMHNESDPPFDFDARGLFDSTYLREKDLISPKYAGLCDKVIERYTTMKVLSKSRAPMHMWHATERKNNVIIIESPASNLFRIIGSARHLSSSRCKDHALMRYITDATMCSHLINGQSTRADKYNLQMDRIIMERATSKIARDATAMAAEGTLKHPPSVVRAQIQAAITKVLRLKGILTKRDIIMACSGIITLQSFNDIIYAVNTAVSDGKWSAKTSDIEINESFDRMERDGVFNIVIGENSILHRLLHESHANIETWPIAERNPGVRANV